MVSTSFLFAWNDSCPDAIHHSLGRAEPCLGADKGSNIGQSFPGTFPTRIAPHLRTPDGGKTEKTPA